MKEREIQVQAVSQGICCLQLSHPGEMNATEIEIQGSESGGESFSSWTNAKGHRWSEERWSEEKVNQTS